MISNRMLAGVVVMGTDESRTFIADLREWAAEWGNPVSIESCTLYDRTLKQYVNDKLSGDFALAGTIVESKMVSGLEVPSRGKHRYQLNILVNFPSSQQLSGFFPIESEL